jgi:hypothetical protein
MAHEDGGRGTDDGTLSPLVQTPITPVRQRQELWRDEVRQLGVSLAETCAGGCGG